MYDKLQDSRIYSIKQAFIGMYKDFIVKQTTDYDSQFKAKTLVGNWYEQRCDPGKPQNYHFYKERKLGEDNRNSTLTEQNFQNSTSNWLNFQQIPPSQTFRTEYKDNFLESEKQKRLSVLNPFITKKGEFQKNEKALDEYRQKWTKSRNVFDFSRTSIGHTRR